MYEDKWFSVSVRPIAFVTQNRPYVPNPAPTPSDGFRDPFVGYGLDTPFRFGSGVYGRIDPGETWLEARLGWLATGFTTASQHWGPSINWPLTMGTEGGGYPRIFLEGETVPLGFGQATVQWSVGRLEASGYGGQTPGLRSRIVPALVASFTPRGFPGLEIGGARFFHVRWQQAVIDGGTLLLPFRGLLKQSAPTGEAKTGDQNQLGSVFIRLAPRGSGLEVFGEFYREDHNYNLVDLVGEPDHASAFVVGLRRAWMSDNHRLTAVTIEGLNSRISHLARVRSQGPLHTHTSITEGHSIRGQSLASSAVPGGGGVVVTVDRVNARNSYFARGEVRRWMQISEGGTVRGRIEGVYAIRLGRRLLQGQNLVAGDIGWQLVDAQGGPANNFLVSMSLERSRLIPATQPPRRP